MAQGGEKTTKTQRTERKTKKKFCVFVSLWFSLTRNEVEDPGNQQADAYEGGKDFKPIDELAAQRMDLGIDSGKDYGDYGCEAGHHKKMHQDFLPIAIS
jgi:hypothetical protein